jgi:hypothetical protein
MKTVASNDLGELVAGENNYKNYEGRAFIHQRKIPDQRAVFAQDMMRTWGMVVGRPAIAMEPQDKREMTLMPVSEVIERACSMADLAFKEFAARGWLLETPSWEELHTPPTP